MEEDYLDSASKRFWQTVRRLRRGKQYSANTVYSAGGELLTSTGDIVGRWKKYFEVGWWSLFLKRGPEIVFQLQGITLLSLPGKVSRQGTGEENSADVWPIVDPRIQEEQCGFRPGRGTLDQLYTLHRVLEGLWEFAQPVHMCFVDLEKAFEPCPSWYSVGVLHEYGVRGAFAKGCSVSVRPEQELGSHCRQ
ncbi:hypothetical protein L3Q82_007755 [Scortum barcoo]|uniref:Uncharacterized protein n=1 Tax=Scortum barcoo TaxID=214431 RepID=A0ACB8WP92_9TELE|nr:hypothetical protein L3Q82_007755 [Scortum barcoo]